MAIDFNSLPILKSFDRLKRGDKVYSNKHGVGYVASLYQKDQIIVQFDSVRMRLSLLEQDVAVIPKDLLSKPKLRTEVYIGSKKVSFKEYKKQKKLNETREANQKILDQIKKQNEKRTNKFPESLFD